MVGVIMVIGKGWINSGDWEVGKILYDTHLGVVFTLIGKWVGSLW